MRRLFGTVLIALSFGLVACASGSSSYPYPSASDSPTGHTVSPGGPGGTVREPKVVTPRPGMVRVRSVPWEKARPRAAGRELVVSFWSGLEPCHVLDRVEVGYGAETVEVTLFEGTEPGAEDVACAELALFKAVVVPLDEPLNGRAIRDGAASRP